MSSSPFLRLPGVVLAFSVAACRPGVHDAQPAAHAHAPAPADRAARDCPDCPAMVAIPGGSFLIGSPDDEPGRYRFEGPQHGVSIAAFAIGQTEVPRRESPAFVRDTPRPEAGGCLGLGDGTIGSGVDDPNASWRAPGFDQTDAHPVVCVSWQDAHDYAAWLAGKTGLDYRLPSESEWEYAARAGTTTPYYWGERADRGCDYMNGGDPSLVRAVPVWAETIGKALASGEAGAELVG